MLSRHQEGEGGRVEGVGMVSTTVGLCQFSESSFQCVDSEC